MPPLTVPNPVDLSVSFLEASRRGEGAFERRQLARISRDELASALPDDRHREAFWINVYNAYIQLLLRGQPGAYRHRGRFFAKHQLIVARKRLSLNDIEHGILRRSMFGYSLGYVPNPFPGKFERRFRLEHRDPRVHFALNCGARSCPPIAAYTPGEVDQQLDRATSSYLRSETKYDPANDVVRVPRILSWFRGDFGGKKGILDLLRQQQLIPEAATPTLKFGTYDWALTLDEDDDRA